MVFSRKSPVCLHPYFGYRSDRRAYLRARALRSRRPGFEKGGRWQAVRTLIAQYASREVAGIEVTLTLAAPDGMQHRFSATTDDEGYAVFDVALPHEWALPARARWEVGDLAWENEEGPQTVQGHVLAPSADHALAVISDIDDTIIETGITGGARSLLRNWRRVLAQFPEERIAVPGADAFYTALGGSFAEENGGRHAGDTLPATRRSFFYVSSSPWNLYAYLVAFKRAKGIPLGPLTLRDWGLNRETFGASSHGGHKVAAIERILDMYPERRFALIGDDTQGDVTAYGDVVQNRPGRIAAIFIRKAAAEDLDPEEQAAKAMIEAANVPLWIGPSFTEGQQFLASTGLAADEEHEGERLVEAVEEEAEAMAHGHAELSA